MTKINVGSLYACDTAEPYGIAVYEVYTENGQWHQKWGADGSTLISILKCTTPLLVVDLPGEHSIDNDLALSLYRGATGDSPWVACLYEERLVVLPQSYFEKPLSRFINEFYTEVKAGI